MDFNDKEILIKMIRKDFKEKISKLPQPSSRLKIDILYRISFPYRMHGGNANKIFVFGTSEYQKIDNMIYQGEELNEKYINKSIKVITSSNWSKVGFIQEGFKENDVIVIPCGVDLKIFKPINKEKKNKIRKKLNINNDHFVFLNVSAMTWNKGINKLLVAFSVIKRKYSFAKLILKDQSNLYKETAKNYISITKKKNTIEIKIIKLNPNSKDSSHRNHNNKIMRSKPHIGWMPFMALMGFLFPVQILLFNLLLAYMP